MQRTAGSASVARSASAIAPYIDAVSAFFFAGRFNAMVTMPSVQLVTTSAVDMSITPKKLGPAGKPAREYYTPR
ncbi:MAG: hypothetical protein AMXMBFR52_24690 [Burkholderiales bacterium]